MHPIPIDTALWSRNPQGAKRNTKQRTPPVCTITVHQPVLQTVLPQPTSSHPVSQRICVLSESR